MIFPIELPQLIHVVQLRVPLVRGRGRALNTGMSLFGTVAPCGVLVTF